MMFYRQSFFGGGFFGGTGAAGGWGLGQIHRLRDPEEVLAAREAFGAIPEAVQAAIDAMARRYALADEWDEDELRKELLHGLHGAPWSSHYLDALMEALDKERSRQEKLAEQMRYFRIAPCSCGGIPGWVNDEGAWSVECVECGASGPADERPTVALRKWNGSQH